MPPVPANSQQPTTNSSGSFCDLGHMAYREAWDVQLSILDRLKDNPSEGGALLFVEHPPVLTLGANFHEENLLHTRDEYTAMGIEVITTDRGGDVTFHGPRQLVIYPVFHIPTLVGKDLHLWLRQLEEVIIQVALTYNLQAERFPPNTGVWTNGKKLAAIGIKVSRWISTHGIALNCDNDLAPFDTIVPCGIHDYGVTSLTNETGRRVTIEDTKPRVLQAFETVFNIKLDHVALADLLP